MHKSHESNKGPKVATSYVGRPISTSRVYFTVNAAYVEDDARLAFPALFRQALTLQNPLLPYLEIYSPSE